MEINIADSIGTKLLPFLVFTFRFSESNKSLQPEALKFLRKRRKENKKRFNSIFFFDCLKKPKKKKSDGK